MPTTDIENIARNLVTQATKKLSPMTFLQSAAASMTRSDLETLAVAYLYTQVKNRKRGEVRVVERAATTDIKKMPRWGTAAWRTWSEMPENEEEANREREYRNDLARADEEASKKLWGEMGSIIEKFKDDMHTQWTEELLQSKFALGDGTETTWGMASRANHEYRLNMHLRNASAGIEGAARHQQAIDELDATGASNLLEAVRVAA